jgi:hypothetical protein
MMPGSPRFLDLVTVWCLAFEIMIRTAIEMPAAFARETQSSDPSIEITHEPAKSITNAHSAANFVTSYLSTAEREFLEGSHAGRH